MTFWLSSLGSCLKLEIDITQHHAHMTDRLFNLISNQTQMFESRPIWSRNAVKANIEIHPDKLKLLLPVVAYYMVRPDWGGVKSITRVINHTSIMQMYLSLKSFNSNCFDFNTLKQDEGFKSF